jgi:hypothetical protein
MADVPSGPSRNTAAHRVLYVKEEKSLTTFRSLERILKFRASVVHDETVGRLESAL